MTSLELILTPHVYTYTKTKDDEKQPRKMRVTIFETMVKGKADLFIQSLTQKYEVRNKGESYDVDLASILDDDDETVNVESMVKEIAAVSFVLEGNPNDKTVEAKLELKRRLPRSDLPGPKFENIHVIDLNNMSVPLKAFLPLVVNAVEKKIKEFFRKYSVGPNALYAMRLNENPFYDEILVCYLLKYYSGALGDLSLTLAKLVALGQNVDLTTITTALRKDSTMPISLYNSLKVPEVDKLFSVIERQVPIRGIGKKDKYDENEMETKVFVNVMVPSYLGIRKRHQINFFSSIAPVNVTVDSVTFTKDEVMFDDDE